MTRISKAQQAGLDLLDQISFSELVVHLFMDDHQQGQLSALIHRVNQLVKSKYSGHEAELIKHLVYSFLEINLINTSKEWKEKIEFPMPRVEITQSSIDSFEDHEKTFGTTVLFLMNSGIAEIESDYALHIYETIKAEFVGLSALVRRDLVTRCFVYEFEEACVKSYCWLTITGILRVTKNSSDRLNNTFKDDFLIRLSLVANYNMTLNYLKTCIGKADPASIILQQSCYTLGGSTVERLLNIKSAFNASKYSEKLQGIPQLEIFELQNEKKLQNFFEQYGARKVRLRMHNGTLASWLSFIGAGMVNIQLRHESRSAGIENHTNGNECVENTNLKIRAIFNASNNTNTITENVMKKLSTYGLKINSDTLYRKHSEFSRSTLPYVNIYCVLTHDTGLVMSPCADDIIYMSIFSRTENNPS